MSTLGTSTRLIKQVTLVASRGEGSLFAISTNSPRGNRRAGPSPRPRPGSRPRSRRRPPRTSPGRRKRFPRPEVGQFRRQMRFGESSPYPLSLNSRLTHAGQRERGGPRRRACDGHPPLLPPPRAGPPRRSRRRRARANQLLRRLQREEYTHTEEESHSSSAPSPPPPTPALSTTSTNTAPTTTTARRPQGTSGGNGNVGCVSIDDREGYHSLAKMRYYSGLQILKLQHVIGDGEPAALLLAVQAVQAAQTPFSPVHFLPMPTLTSFRDCSSLNL